LANPRRSIRGPVAIGLAIALGVAACGGSSSQANPSAQASSAGRATVAAGRSRWPLGQPGQADQLSLHRVERWGDRGVSASPAGSGSYEIAGTVVNRPVKSIWIGETQGQFILIGGQAWASGDGITWVASDPADTILTDLLPGHDYALWFDAKASYFRAVGDESKNGVPCVHYTADASSGASMPMPPERRRPSGPMFGLPGTAPFR